MGIFKKFLDIFCRTHSRPKFDINNYDHWFLVYDFVKDTCKKQNIPNSDILGLFSLVKSYLNIHLIDIEFEQYADFCKRYYQSTKSITTIPTPDYFLSDNEQYKEPKKNYERDSRGRFKKKGSE